MAFVLLPHLDPGHQSLMVELLAKQTSLPVCAAQDGQQVEANRIYILPPAKSLTIHNGKLQLSAIEGPRQPWTAIDRFLRSLADDQRERAVGIILSGTGSHGTLGLKEIKLAGGIVLAQDPETAGYSQMPDNAIATGLVDLVLPPASMPAALLAYVKHPYVDQTLTEQQVATEEINSVLAVLHARTRYDFRGYRQNMLMRRIQRRMGLCHIDTVADYNRYLRKNPEETTALYKDLLIGVTAFFREPEAFHVLQQRVIPELIAHSNVDNPVRVWVPACATGEEAYTLAMLMLEGFGAAKTLPNMQIFATDIDDDSLAVARQGMYPDSIAADVSAERLQRFFVKTGDNKYKINKQLRDSLVFATQNLIGNAPFSRLDLISCRNLLIYLQPEMQAKVIQLFHFSLKDGGYLLLGPSESIGRQTDLFEPLSKKWRVFRRVGPTRRDIVDIPIAGSTLIHPAVKGAAAREASGHPDGHFAELVRKRLLDNYAPASVLINRNFEILHFYGPTVDYLELPSGEPTRNLLAMSREGLRTHVRAVVHRALQDRQPVVDTGARVKRNGRYIPCSITARPVHERGNEELALVSFENGDTSTATETGQADESPASVGANEEIVIQQLEHELKATREDLQSTIEELETSNEELKSSNEEVMSMNEELQSANEELETSKEELQSMNEELNTVNTELQTKVEELEKSHDDIHNLLASSDIATIFLDRDMHIQLFSPPTAGLLKLRPGDIGRPISDFSANLANDNLLPEAQQVLQSLMPVEKDVWSSDDPAHRRCYLRRIVPYRSADTRIGGVVITFVDITERHRVEEQLEERVAGRTRELREREERLRAVKDSVADAIILVDKDGLIQSVNPACERIFGYPADELIGHNVNMLMPSPYREEHDSYIARYLKTGKTTIIGQRRELTGCRKDGSNFPLELTVTEVDHLRLFTGVVRDLSEKRALEREVADVSAQEQERIGREIHDGIGQQLTGLNILAVSLRNELAAAGYSKESEKLDDMIRLLTALIGDARALARGLAPVAVSPRGLVDALKELADRVDKTMGVACSFKYNQASLDLKNDTTATQIYRIVQETVNNSLKHAGASHIDIDLDVANDNINLAVRDDGKGFDLDAVQHTDGFGLRIMQYRAGILGGRLVIDTAPGEGAQIRLRIPYEEHRA